ncbi:MAG: LysE family translocator [Gammaproteobacteria bacterium]
MPGIDFFVPMAVFAISTLITPGPNNMMLAASGVSYGFRRTRPLILGICFGHSGMTFVIGVGLGPIFTEYPQVLLTMRYLAFVFICWIAWRIARADIDKVGSGKPMTFFQGALFQWINPKAVAMSVGALSLFMTGEAALLEAALISGIFLVFALPSQSLWALFGAAIGNYLRGNRRMLRVFNITMAALLILAMLPTLF